MYDLKPLLGINILAQLDANGDDDSDQDQEITHSVPFKCIGAAHEKNYQHHLEQEYFAFEQNTSVKVHLRAEPLNPLDPSAIGIDLTMELVHLMLDILLQNFANICTTFWLQEILSMLMCSILTIGRLL